MTLYTWRFRACMTGCLAECISLGNERYAVDRLDYTNTITDAILYPNTSTRTDDPNSPRPSVHHFHCAAARHPHSHSHLRDQRSPDDHSSLHDHNPPPDHPAPSYSHFPSFRSCCAISYGPHSPCPTREHHRRNSHPMGPIVQQRCCCCTRCCRWARRRGSERVCRFSKTCCGGTCCGVYSGRGSPSRRAAEELSIRVLSTPSRKNLPSYPIGR